MLHQTSELVQVFKTVDLVGISAIPIPTSINESIGRTINVELAVPNMSFPTSPCYVVVLNQQQQQTSDHCNESADDARVKHSKTTPKNCTVVEDGRVVVRPSTTP